MNQIVEGEALHFRLRQILGSSLVLIVALAIPGPASATVFSFNVKDYSKANGGSNDGAAGAPSYCFRADGILGIGSPVTFSCEEPGTGVQLDYDDAGTPALTTDDSVRIFGTLFGGLDVGTVYDATKSGFANIDFTYTENIALGLGIDVTVNPESRTPPANTGTLKFLSDWPAMIDGTTVRNITVNLVDEDGGKGFSFKFNNDSDSKGCPGGILCSDPTLWHGWGWTNYDGSNSNSGFPDNHEAATDWLFIAERVPEPSSLVLLGAGLAGLGFIGRRRRQT